MMVYIGTRVAPVNNAFSTSRSVALIERKTLQNTTFFIKFHHYTLSKLKNLNFQNVRPPCFCLSTMRGSETTLNAGLFNKIF